MGSSILRRGLEKAAVGFYRCRTYCSFSGEKVPWLMLPPVFDESRKLLFNFHSLGNKEAIITEKLGFSEKLDEVYFAGSSHGWLFVHNWAKQDLIMMNPITGGHIKLPSLPDPEGGGGISRVALSCSPDQDQDQDQDEEYCRAMVIFGRGKKLGLCIPGRSTDWTPISHMKFEDVAYSTKHKLFFSINSGYRSSEVQGWDVGEPLCPRIDWRLPLHFDEPYYPWPSQSKRDAELKSECWHIKYLLVYGHHLFLVVRHINPRTRNSYDHPCAEEPLYISKYRGWECSYPYRTVDFDVYKIGRLDKRCFRCMKCSLEGLAMFIGTNESFAVAASEHPELKPNCIYFSDENRLVRKSRAFINNEFGGHDNGIFDYQTNTFSSCCADITCPLNPLDYDDIKSVLPPPLWYSPSNSTLS